MDPEYQSQSLQRDVLLQRVQNETPVVQGWTKVVGACR